MDDLLGTYPLCKVPLVPLTGSWDIPIGKKDGRLIENTLMMTIKLSHN